MLFESGNGRLDVSRLFLDDVDLDAGRKRLVDLVELRDDVVDDLDGVRADLAADVQHDGGLALVIRESALLRHAVFGVRRRREPGSARRRRS